MITGERAVTGEGGFNPSWQRHAAHYHLCAPLLPDGEVLDLGCGVGHSFEALAPRPSVGVDLDAASLAEQDRPTVCADMRALPFADGRFASVLCSHAIEHVPDPQRVLAEARRVLAPGGVAIFVTPNRLTFARADEIIDPYHYAEYDPAQLAALCATSFDEVEVLGLFGSPRFDAFVAGEHERLERILRADALRLRRFVPRRARQLGYDLALTLSRREVDPAAAAITIDDFELRGDDVDRAFDLVAVCRSSK